MRGGGAADSPKPPTTTTTKGQLEEDRPHPDHLSLMDEDELQCVLLPINFVVDDHQAGDQLQWLIMDTSTDLMV